MEEKNYKKYLIIVLIISVLVIGLIGMELKSQKESYDYLKDNTEYKCRDGTKQICIQDNEDYITYSESQEIVVCNKFDYDGGICVPRGYNYNFCEKSLYGSCEK